MLDEAELLRIATWPGCRRQGLAEKLLAEAFARLEERAIGSLFLEVEEANLPATRLYEKLGFRTDRPPPRHYPAAPPPSSTAAGCAGEDPVKEDKNLGGGR